MTIMTTTTTMIATIPTRVRTDRLFAGTTRLGLLVACIAVSIIPARAVAQSCLAGTAADEFTADAAGLTREWILQLPAVAAGTSLKKVVVGDGLVVAQTSDGTVHAIQAAPFGDGLPPAGAPRRGALLWSRHVDTGGGPTVAAGIGADLVTVPHESGVTGLERLTGHPRWHTELGHSAAAATVIGDWVYAPSQGGTVTRLPVNPLRQPAITKAADSGKKSGQKSAKKTAKPAANRIRRKETLEPVPIYAGGDARVELAPLPLADGVLWCTADGMLVSLQATDLEWRRQEFSLVNPPSGLPAIRDRSIFAATTAGDLARIELPGGLKEMELTWHAVLPGPAVSGPFLSGDTVVVSLGDLGIAAYSAETGAELWHTCLTGTILGIGGGRLWLIDERGLLSGFDLADGTPRERLCLGPFTLPVVNTQSDRLLLASPAGTLVSLVPRGGRGEPTPAEATDASDASGRAAPEPGSSDPDATPQP